MKIKKIFLLFLICVTHTILLGQGENDNWYFGDMAAINFSSSTPIALTNSQMTASEACGSISDANGNLLFYTNGEKIWNRQHQPMLNGTGLLGNVSSEQLAIVKNPVNVNQYYVFTTAESSTNISSSNRISYSIVDMSLGSLGTNAQPLGGILPNFKNIAVTDNSGNNFGSEAITIVAGSAANTYWVLIPNGNNLYSYKIDNLGFSNGNPIISNLNFPVSLGFKKYYSIKASPKLNNPNFSNFIVVSHWGDNNNLGNNTQSINRVMSFNATTGSINNSYSLNVNSIMAYLPEFNQNGSVLFLGNISIFAVNLQTSTTGNVNSLQIFTGSGSDPYTAIQRNKNGAIYITKYNSNFLGTINNPNIYGSSMNVTQNAINLGSGQHLSRYGLPQLIPISDGKSGTYYPCIDSLTLTSEPNFNFDYEAGKKITTKDKYIITYRYNITMKAGESINLLPGTQILNGANYHAFIAPCREKSLSSQSKNPSQVGMILDLDKIERSENLILNDLKISPNPTSDFINIDSGKEKIISWELFDISLKSILKGDSSQINVQSLPKAIYILKINISKKQITKKVIVK